MARAVIAHPQILLADSRRESAFEQGKGVMELFRKLDDAGTTIVR